MNIEQKLDNIAKKLMPVLLEAAVRWTQENFKQQQWEGSKWPARKKETRRSAGKALLTDRRDMYNAIRVVNASSFGVVGIPYARIHNQGGSITHPARTRQLTFKRYKAGKYKGRTLFAKNNNKASFSQKAQSGAYGINIPQRKFIGNSPVLRRHLVSEAKARLKSRL